MRRERPRHLQGLLVLAVVPEPDAGRLVAALEQPLQRESRVMRPTVRDHQDVGRLPVDPWSPRHSGRAGPDLGEGQLVTHTYADIGETAARTARSWGKLLSEHRTDMDVWRDKCQIAAAGGPARDAGPRLLLRRTVARAMLCSGTEPAARGRDLEEWDDGDVRLPAPASPVRGRRDGRLRGVPLGGPRARASLRHPVPS